MVRTSLGRVRGATAGGVHVFKGIPYGASTGGANRFVPPKPPAPWTGVRDALSFGPMAMQTPESGERYLSVLRGLYPSLRFPLSEDCLLINIWSPELGSATKRPVMVWLHPGGFAVGAGNSPWTDGSSLAHKRDVVVVSLNHRLGIFGHLCLRDLGGPKYAESGNVGMLDIVAALTWVHENITQFGGDPDNVTIFGESGGGGKVSVLMAMPSAKGLFHKAIVQSGAWNRALRAEQASQSARGVLKQLQLNSTELPELNRIPATRLLQLEGHFAPVVAGDSLPRNPFDPDAPAISADVPMLSGTTHDEATYFSLNDPPPDVSDGEAVSTSLVGTLSGYGAGDKTKAERLLQAYRELHPTATLRDCFYGLGTALITHAQIVQAERKVAQGAAPVFMYLFSWATPALNGTYKSGHAVEVPFVFNNLNAAPQLLGPRPDPRCYDLAEKISKAWSAFAHTGSPSHMGLPKWDAYDLNQRATMEFNYSCGLLRDPHRENRLLLERLV